MVDFASVNRRAMILRIELCGTSLCGALIAVAGMGAGARAAGIWAGVGVGDGVRAGDPAGAPDRAASISARTIRPFGPLPLSAVRSMPACAAMRRARGDA